MGDELDQWVMSDGCLDGSPKKIPSVHNKMGTSVYPSGRLFMIVTNHLTP